MDSASRTTATVSFHPDNTLLTLEIIVSTPAHQRHVATSGHIAQSHRHACNVCLTLAHFVTAAHNHATQTHNLRHASSQRHHPHPMMVSLAATSLTLIPTSTPREIYAQINSLNDLRRQSNLFEAALSAPQPRGGADEEGNDGVKQRSTCFKLYQAVRSLKKRDNKKDKRERLYSTLAAAFDAHRQRTLDQDRNDETRRGGSQHADEPTAQRTTFHSSRPPQSWAPAIATPTTAATEAARRSVHVPSGSAGSSNPPRGGEASNTSLDHPSDATTTQTVQALATPGRRVDTDEMRRVLHQLSESAGRFCAQLRTVEQELWMVQTQLDGCRHLLGTWEVNVNGAEEPGDDQEPIAPVSFVAMLQSSASTSSPVHGGQAEAAMRWEGAAQTNTHDELRPLATPASSTQPARSDDARDNRADDDADVQNVDGGVGVLDEPKETDRVRGAKSDGSARHSSSKRCRSPSEDGGVGSKRQRRSDAPVDGSTASDRRCVWVQSQWEMCEDDLTTIFSHFGRVERVDVPRPRPGSLPFAFVHFEAEEDATWSIRRAVDGALGCLMVRAYQRRREAGRASRRVEQRPGRTVKRGKT